MNIAGKAPVEKDRHWHVVVFLSVAFMLCYGITNLMAFAAAATAGVLLHLRVQQSK